MAHHYSGPDFSFPHGDARVDHCDLFAFPSPGDASRSVLAIDVHPSFGINPDGPTTTEPFSPEAVYELKVDTNGDGVADVAFRVRVSVRDGAQSATVRRVEGADAAGAGDGGEILVEDASVSTGSKAQVTETGQYRFFAGWRSDPFFFDAEGVLNDFQFTGQDFFADKDVCSIVLEVPNNALGASGGVAMWHRTLVPAGDTDARRRAGDRHPLRGQLRPRPGASWRVPARGREAGGRDAAARRPTVRPQATGRLSAQRASADR